ncbi:mavicyanin-like [Durio zibethinus]|uniref:Mavicyanin-like n=1 Tax=Durio zibethinus TaxID=66656 RepID=A0A6P5X9C5_DURZI|nr:mavicyanin-like [Durio zibethinus]
MGLAKRAVLFSIMIMVGICGLSMAAVYNVGDSAGWTILGGGLDYQDWAATKKFFVGDILVFEYNNQYHDVTQVNVEDFKSCNPESPITRYGNGTDAVTLASPGEYYFLCGFPGHCQAGQKLHITVNSAGSAASPIPPANNVAPSPYTTKLSSLAMTFAVILPSFLLLV